MFYPHDDHPLSLKQKIFAINRPLFVMATLLSLLGVLMLFSAGEGSFYPWAFAHFMRFIMAIMVCLMLILSPIKIIYKSSYILYGISIILLILTALIGETHKGAQRWLNIGFHFQPSELCKITVILALARFFHEAYQYRIVPLYMITIALTLVGLPFILVLKQPDLGTSLLILFSCVTVMFLANISWRFFAGSALLIALSAPLIWLGIKPYQKQRILTFLNPESDPLGTGYHIAQAKIAMGSGGVSGRGFMKGPQSMLEFLPEKHTDFAFTAFAEQFGFIGSIILLCIFVTMIIAMMNMAYRCQHIFGKLLITGLATNFFFYLFINMAMVMGLIPVVGVPMPFLSYGGTVMISIFIAFGLMQNSLLHYKVTS